jgi:phosphate-selective porin OprO and OprP
MVGLMKKIIPSLLALVSVVFLSAQDIQVTPKSSKITDLKFSGRIQGQWDGIESDPTTATEDRNHFYFRRLFLGGHAKMGENWGGDIVLDFAASPNSEDGKADQVFIEGASVWYKTGQGYRFDLGQKKVPFGLEETSSSAKMKTIERSAVNRQFAETLKFNARHTGLFASGNFGASGLSASAAIVNSGQNHNSKDSALNDGLYGYASNDFSYFGRISFKNEVDDLSYLFGVEAGFHQNEATKADNTTAWNIFTRIGKGPFEFEAEYMSGTADVAGGDHDHDGYSLQGCYTIDRENKGDWELVYRFSTVQGKGSQDLVSAKEIIRRTNFTKDSNGGPWEMVDEFDQHYLGVNYLFNGHDIKFMLGYEMNDLTDTEENGGSQDIDGLRARLQFLF